MRVRAWRCAALALLVGGSVLSAQPLDRLKGRVHGEGGVPVSGADVRIEALFGFRGESYAGQRLFTARTDGKGEWALIGFKAGIWMFDASAPDQLPDAIALPIGLIMAPSSGIGGLSPPWHPMLRTSPLPPGEIGAALTEAAEAALAGRPNIVTPLLARLADTSNADVLAAAGAICLLLRDATIARPFFRRALDRDPDSFRAWLGMGSTALMQLDYDAAAKAFGEARNRTKDKDERGYLTAAIGDLNKASVTFNRTGH